MIITFQNIERALQGLSASSTIEDVKRVLLDLGVKPLRNRKGLDMEAYKLDLYETTCRGCTSYTRVNVAIYAGESSCEASTSYYYKIK